LIGVFDRQTAVQLQFSCSWRNELHFLMWVFGFFSARMQFSSPHQCLMTKNSRKNNRKRCEKIPFAAGAMAADICKADCVRRGDHQQKRGTGNFDRVPR
jgi:hypothetical protein